MVSRGVATILFGVCMCACLYTHTNKDSMWSELFRSPSTACLQHILVLARKTTYYYCTMQPSTRTKNNAARVTKKIHLVAGCRAPIHYSSTLTRIFRVIDSPFFYLPKLYFRSSTKLQRNCTKFCFCSFHYFAVIGSSLLFLWDRAWQPYSISFCFVCMYDHNLSEICFSLTC